jgi:RNA 2',3'-cyclic 3'-phosphodiesterase
MSTVRAFVALEIGRGLAARLGTVQGDLRAAGVDAAWVKPESMHLTLKFLDEVPEKQVAKIAGALVHVAAKRAPFTMSVVGLGIFPTFERPRVIWAGVREGAEEVTALAREVEKALFTLGLPRAENPFHPHLTLGRVRVGTRFGALGRTVMKTQKAVYGEVQVREMRLLRSDLLPEGAQHTVLATANFVGGA